MSSRQRTGGKSYFVVPDDFRPPGMQVELWSRDEAPSEHGAGHHCWAFPREPVGRVLGCVLGEGNNLSVPGSSMPPGMGMGSTGHGVGHSTAKFAGITR